MNNSDFNEKSAGYLIGKEFVIVIVVVFSALSFTLGFFVGKSGRAEPRQPVAVLPQQDQPVAQAQQPGVSPGQQQPAATPAPQPAAPPEKKIEEIVIEQPKEKAAPPSAQKPSAPAAQTVSVRKVAEAPAAPADQVYSVQLGAFRSQNEAKTFKLKYEKKGIKSFIVPVTGKQKEKIYKVKTGEYPKRTDAEMLTVRLKKSEGLNAFVTLRNE